MIDIQVPYYQVPERFIKYLIVKYLIIPGTVKILKYLNIKYLKVWASIFWKEVSEIISMLEDCYPEGMSETELNDFFWFEDDTIAEWLGWPDFETLMKARDGDHWFKTFEEWKEAQEDEEEEEEEEE